MTTFIRLIRLNGEKVGRMDANIVNWEEMEGSEKALNHASKAGRKRYGADLLPLLSQSSTSSSKKSIR